MHLIRCCQAFLKSIQQFEAFKKYKTKKQVLYFSNHQMLFRMRCWIVSLCLQSLQGHEWMHFPQFISFFKPPLNLKTLIIPTLSPLCYNPHSVRRREGLEDSVIFSLCTCHCQGSAGALQQWRPVNNPGVRSSDGASSAGSVLLSEAIYPKQLLA